MGTRYNRLAEPHLGGSNENPLIICFRNMKNTRYFFFLSVNLPFLVLKFTIYLNRRVFVMNDRTRQQHATTITIMRPRRSTASEKMHGNGQ